MSLHERYGQRDLTYSAWHRPASIGRYLPTEEALRLTYVDIDAVEVCDGCYEPLALLELARDVGQAHKPTTIMARLAQRANIPAGLVFYLPAADGSDIIRFRVRASAPQPGREHVMAPAAYARWLQSLRRRHECPAVRGPVRRPPSQRPERRGHDERPERRRAR